MKRCVFHNDVTSCIQQWHTACIYKVDKFTFLFLRKAAGRNIEKLSEYIYFSKILDWSKLKAFADDKIDVALMISLSDRVENTVGKGENAGYQHFLLYPQCFQKPSV